MHLVLLVKAEGRGEYSERPSIHVDGTRLAVASVSNISDVQRHAKSFICVSYVWGSSRVSNPTGIGPDKISSNTIPALISAMQNTNISAFWIDAFCVPVAQPAHSATLESMGYIYSQAEEVRAVLSETAFGSIAQLRRSDRLDMTAMLSLEQDHWVQSVWTYQEVVNCRNLRFVCPGALGDVIDGSHFLNGLGYSIAKYKEHHQIDSYEFRREFPSLDAFEDLIADWMIAGPEERSAMAVMSNMHRRVWTEDKNYFYAMIGAITTAPRRRSDVKHQHLAETFMEVCEAKGDFSFIYSSAPRSAGFVRTWRPRAGLLPSILPWHSWGNSQPGHFDEAGQLWLHQVLVHQTSPLSSEVKAHLAHWLHQADLAQETEVIIRDRVFEAISGMGFTGSRIAVPLSFGFFFPQTALPGDVVPNLKIIVSSILRWTIGAPGLAVSRDNFGSPPTFTPGVLAGIVNDSGSTTVCLG